MISQNWLHGVFLDVKSFFVPGTGFDTGRELVNRVVSDTQKTTISFEAGQAGADRADPSVNWMATKGDATVAYDPAFTPSLPEFNPATGKVNDVAVDPGIAIGHELIHATHIMAGQISGLSPVNYTGVDGTPHRAKFDEEARTVGVGGSPRADDITENDLRRQNGIDLRNNYSDYAVP
ncbi:M91 family zinc metallopeptidase [Puniceibacterium antarcticum]|uniref:M91 family zinc metallopeptidase n=1 Tax=Puniceibacterium antarcticum TaxID=1206336 RepID=UPI001C5571E4|nr:M91 family zinc metallopeptidase [Puniceibacterium antarcticum]